MQTEIPYIYRSLSGAIPQYKKMWDKNVNDNFHYISVGLVSLSFGALSLALKGLILYDSNRFIAEWMIAGGLSLMVGLLGALWDLRPSKSLAIHYYTMVEREGRARLIQRMVDGEIPVDLNDSEIKIAGYLMRNKTFANGDPICCFDMDILEWLLRKQNC